MRAPAKFWTLAITGIGLLAQGASAGTLVHLKEPVWGCLDPNVTPIINNQANPDRLDPQWVARKSDEGHCVILTPNSLWEPLSRDWNGLTYLAYRGPIGKPGSFWVPTAAVDFSSPVQAASPVKSTQSRPPPGPTPLSRPQSAVQETAPTGPELATTSQVTVVTVSPVATAPPSSATADPAQQSTIQLPAPLMPEPPAREGPPRRTSATTDGRGVSVGGTLAIPALLAIIWLARRSRRSKAIHRRDKLVEARTQVPDVSVRIHRSALAEATARLASQKPSLTSHPKTVPPSVAAQPVVGARPPEVLFRIHPSSLAQPPVSPASRQLPHTAPANADPTDSAVATQLAIWYPKGRVVTVAGLIVADGMVYVGRASGVLGKHDASFIDPALPVASTSRSAGPLEYWPSYRALTPECRRRYLEWLVSGKKAPDADIGYVFLYFYGLECRLLVEAPEPEEVLELVAELNRLRTIYASNRSFDGYSQHLLEAVAFLQDTASQSPFIPDLAAPLSEMPLSLKVAIAREVFAGHPLRFELAAAALFGLREFWSGHRFTLDKSRGAYLGVLRARFEATFPLGFPLRNRKNCHLQTTYRGAAGLQIDLAERAELKDLPDPETLTWTKLFTLAGAVAQEIAPYARSIANHPTYTNSLFALVGCPAELRNSVALEARRWLEGLPSPASVPFGELAGHAIGTGTAKWNVRHRRQVSEALAAVGYAMEPNPEDGAEHLEDGTLVQVFRCADYIQSRAMEIACAAAMLVAMVAGRFGGDADKIAEFWLTRVPSRLSLTSSQVIRLRARLAWLATKSVTLPQSSRLLSDATLEEREFCAWSATAAAGIAGSVGKPQIAMLEAIYDALAVPRSALYAGLHAGIGAATGAADDPIVVADGVEDEPHPIPPPPSSVRPNSELGRLARIRAETEQVSAMLADIFVDEESRPDTPEPAGEGPLAGLDPEHAALLTRLLARPEWAREELEAAASKAGLMPSGAMETINEWAFDHYGDALIEDGDPVVVNRALLQFDPETIATK